jgi:hypothetical protein
MNSKPYDVVLIPSDDLVKKAISLSKKLTPLGVHFTLDNETFFPHLSLYMLQLNDGGIIKVRGLLETIAKDNMAISLEAEKYHYEDDYFDVEYTKLMEIISLQEKILDGLNPFRDGLREKDKERLPDSIGETRSNLLKYGYRGIGKMFNPHLTFTRFKSAREKTLGSLPDLESFNETFTQIGLFEMGDNGTCTKKVACWKLMDSPAPGALHKIVP